MDAQADLLHNARLHSCREYCGLIQFVPSMCLMALCQMGRFQKGFARDLFILFIYLNNV